jgi:FtsP/CotA-like multicopper oxidase with cupredoxin domain
MRTDRRTFLTGASALIATPRFLNAFTQATPKPTTSAPAPAALGAATHTLRIEPVTLDISPGVSIKTIGYNGQVPGPLLRLKRDVPVSIDVVNKSGHEDIVHWHGLRTDVINDGAMEEGSPMIPAGKTQRYNLTPNPVGTRWYHTHNSAGADLTKGQYTAQFGFLLVEGKDNPGRYDQEVFLAIHHWDPYFAPMAEVMQENSSQHPASAGSDVAYKHATINGHCLGAGDPIRVKKGQKVLMHLLNASATDHCILSIPGHTFTVLALDGNAVPNPQSTEIVALGAAERVDAIVEMNSPGVWILGSVLPKARDMGLGIVVEYEGATGKPVSKDPTQKAWDYTVFAKQSPAAAPDETITLTFKDAGPDEGSQFDRWTINDQSWPNVDPIQVKQGKRYRLVFQNFSADLHPMHLHRHSFEIAKIGTQEISGLIKDTVNVAPMETVAVDFVADNPGDSLLHCHMQLHMDFGFMTLVKYT